MPLWVSVVVSTSVVQSWLKIACCLTKQKKLYEGWFLLVDILDIVDYLYTIELEGLILFCFFLTGASILFFSCQT